VKGSGIRCRVKGAGVRVTGIGLSLGSSLGLRGKGVRVRGLGFGVKVLVLGV